MNSLILVVVGFAMPALTQNVPLPRECYNSRASIEAPPPRAYNPYENGWASVLLAAIRDRARAGHRVAAGQMNRVFDAFWQQDSLKTEWSLAFLAAEAGYYQLATQSEASEAVQQYRRLSGRAGPVLYILSQPSNDSRRFLALGAIRSVSSQDQQAKLFAIACDAAWFLSAWSRDSAYSRAAAGTNSEVFRAGEVLRLTAHLLDEGRRRQIEAIAIKLDPKWGLQRLR